MPAPAGGVLDQLEVREGMKVAAGQFLAHIADDPVQDKQLAELERDAAKVEAENDDDVRLAEMMVKITQVDLDEGRDARTRAANSISEFDLRRREFQWQRSMLQQKRAERDYHVARINAAAAEQKVTMAQRQIDRRRVEAPFAGVVERVVPKMGEWLEPGDPILHLVDMDRLRAEGFVRSEDFLPHEVFGKPVTVEVQIRKGKVERFASRIGFASATIGADGMFRVFAEIENRITNDNRFAVYSGLAARMILHAQPTAADGSGSNE